MKKHVQYGNYKLDYETVSYEEVKPMPKKPIKELTCCCCGERTQGRQWWNRDTNFGLCVSCADRISQREDEESMLTCYGIRGVHYAINEN